MTTRGYWPLRPVTGNLCSGDALAGTFVTAR
jgi:hypothetical protein